MEERIIVQFGSEEWDVSNLKEKIISSYVAEGHRRGNIKKLSLYVKPEERKVYYVVNEKQAGDVDFD